MKNLTQGLTLIEVLVATALVGIIALIPIFLFVPSAQVDNDSRQRTLALRAAETWLDRYRANQEPQVAAGTVCSVSGATVTCSYPYNYNYPSSDYNTHDASLAEIMKPFRHLIKITVLSAGGNMTLRNIEVNTFWKQGSQEHSVKLMTRIAY